MTPKENLRKLFSGEPTGYLPEMEEIRCFLPACFPDYVARGFVFQQQPFPRERFGGKDWFGAEWHYAPELHGAMEAGEPPLRDVAEWEEKLLFPDLDRVDWDGLARENAEYLDTDRMLSVTVFTGFFERLISLLGYENAAVALIDEEQQEATRALLDRLADFYIDYALRMHRHCGVELLTLHDDWGSQRGLIFSPETHRRMIAPSVKRVIDAVHREGMFYEQHSCGSVRELLPAMAALGVDLWSSQPGLNGEPEELAEQYGDRMCLGVTLSAPAPVEDREAERLMREFLARFAGRRVLIHLDRWVFTPGQWKLFQTMRKEYGRG